jgi:hypothetical protein
MNDKEKAKQLREYSEITYFLAVCMRDRLGNMEYDETEFVELLYEGANRNFGLSEYELYKYYAKLQDDRAESFKEKAKKNGVKDKIDYEKLATQGFGGAVIALNSVSNVASKMNDVVREINSIAGNVASMSDSFVHTVDNLDPENLKSIHQENKNAHTEAITAGLVQEQKEEGQRAVNENKRAERKKTVHARRI